MTRIAIGFISAVTTLLFYLFVLTIHSDNGDAARILGFFPSQSKSNLLVHCALADALAQAGHNVTVIGTMTNVYKGSAKYNYIQLDVPSFDPAFINEAIKNPQPIYKQYKSLMQHVTQLGNRTLAHPTMQQFMREHSENEFDLVILGYFINDFHMGLAAHFHCPLIISSTVQPIFATNRMVGNPHEISYVPTLLSDLQQPMGFMERLKNFLISMFEHYPLETTVREHMQMYYEYNFPSDRYPTLDAMRKNVSLVFTNNHFTQGPVRPNVPAMVEIGGIQIQEQPNPLPVDIAEMLDSAKEQGAIFFSLGTNIQGKNLSQDKAKIMFNVLSKLPYKVLWKWGDTDFPGISSNIMYNSWFPQNDILAHAHTKLFITHGGQGSVVEAQYHGVPMMGIPLFGDQPSNMANVERAGYGRSVDYKELTEESFSEVLLEVIGNPKYAEAVKKFSQLYRDRPMTPRQAVVYWVEYVLRYKGAKHLQSPAVHLKRWQLMSVDVIGFLFAVVVAGVVGFIALCKYLCCRRKKFFKKNQECRVQSKKIKNKNK